MCPSRMMRDTQAVMCVHKFMLLILHYTVYDSKQKERDLIMFRSLVRAVCSAENHVHNETGSSKCTAGLRGLTNNPAGTNGNIVWERVVYST